jgi:hypothetical protein
MRFFFGLLPCALSLSVSPVSGQVLPRDTTVIIASDYALQAPSVIPAGAHTFLMINRGKEPHMVEITRLDAKHDAAEVVEMWRKNLPTPWTVDFGGPNLAAAGDTSNATLVMEPGRYALTCWFEAPDGTLHVMKGMFTQFEVKPVRVERKAPKTNATITLSDYNINLSPMLRRGFNSIRVENRGPQGHDVQLVRINRGRTVQQILNWMESPRRNVASPPGVLMGGMVGIDKGRSGYFTANLRTGDYLLLCFIPDSKDHKPHFRHGMLTQFNIR